VRRRKTRARRRHTTPNASPSKPFGKGRRVAILDSHRRSAEGSAALCELCSWMPLILACGPSQRGRKRLGGYGGRVARVIEGVIEGDLRVIEGLIELSSKG